jgi:hypothetical protein
MDVESVPAWLKIAYGLGAPIIFAVYWREYGATNFLWLSDIALLCTAVSVITGNPLLASMPAVGVLVLEIAWTIDFTSGGRLIGLSAYMFDGKYPYYLRALSLFHLGIPPTLLYLLWRFGYDARALFLQTVLTWTVLVVTYFATDPDKNINWVFGPGSRPQETLPPLVYLVLEMATLPILVFLPTHLVLKHLFRAAGA